MTEGSLHSILDDLASSGLAPQILGVPIREIMADIRPLSYETAKKFFPENSSLFKNGGKELRPKDGYFWEYSGIGRFKNLDPDFLEYKDGKVRIDKVTGLPKPIKYLSGGKTHLYVLPEDYAASESGKGFLWFTEGEKKKRLLSYILHMRLKHQDTFKAGAYPYLGCEYKYGVYGGSGVFNFICTPEWNAIDSKGKPVIVAFDADWQTNTDIPFAELKLVAALVVRGAALKKIKSLVWSPLEGKGIDDYLVRVYRQAMGEGSAFKENGSQDSFIPCVERHPMLDALNRLVKMAIHPFQKYEMMGLDFMCQALASIYRQNLEFKKSQEEDIITYLKTQIFPKSRLSVIRATFADAVKKAKLEQETSGETFLLTEQRNGERFAEEHKERLKWNVTKKEFMLWRPPIWEVDLESSATYQLAIRTLRGIQSEIPVMEGISDERRRELMNTALKDCEKRSHLLNMVAHGKQAQHGMCVPETQFDANPYILNTQNCMLHLDKLPLGEEGVAHHTPGAFCSKVMTTGYEPSAQCPQWMNFINMIFDNTHVVTPEFLGELNALQVDASIIDALSGLQREDGVEYHPEEFEETLLELAGDTIAKNEHIGTLGKSVQSLEEAHMTFVDYCLQRCRKRQPTVDFVQQCVGLSFSGLSNEKILLFCYGPKGNNGKSTFFNVLERILGDYFHRINIESLLFTKMRSQNNDEIADMKGKRMVVTTEVSEGALNVSLIKTLTGAEGFITATRKYEHPMRFPPTHTLWMFGNQEPRVHVINDPIWERIKVIRFPVSLLDILPKDQILPMNAAVEKLYQEASGILNWGLRGWLHYQKHGLLVPREVDLESLKYKNDQDKVGLFFEECCIISTKQDPKPGLKILRGQLYAAYMEWCKENMEKPIGKIRFYDDVERRGFMALGGGANQHFFHDIGLLSDVEAKPDDWTQSN